MWIATVEPELADLMCSILACWHAVKSSAPSGTASKTSLCRESWVGKGLAPQSNAPEVKHYFSLVSRTRSRFKCPKIQIYF